MSIIRVLLAEDHTIVRKGLRALLEPAADVEVIAEAADGREAVAKVGELRPDVVVMDITMPRLNGLEATRQITNLYPTVKIIILSMHNTKEYIFQTLQAGAAGYLIKDAAPAELETAIHEAFKGNMYLSPAISKKVIGEFVALTQSEEEESNLLSSREREVLQLIAEGHSNKEIADLLSITETTVRAHRGHIREKLDLHTTAELALYAARKGIINFDK